VTSKASTKKHLKRQSIFNFLLLLIAVVLLNVLSSFVFTRVDLTTEKRFTLSKPTKNLLGNLKDIVYVKVYLSGDLPSGFQRLSTATRDMLAEMRQYSKGNLEFEFIDPSALTDEKQRNELYKQLAKRGLQPSNIHEKNKDVSSQRILFPGAIMNYIQKEQAVQLLQDRIGTAPEEMLNSSIENLEYVITDAIKKITTLKPPVIAFLGGQGEIDKYHVADIVKTLSSFYTVDYVEIKQDLQSLKKYDCLVVAKPDSTFDEKDKFIIDQFVMKGGKILWLIDKMVADMDSLAKKNEFVSVEKELNLDDMLFRYGARINPDLVLDLQAAPIPMLTGYVGNRPQTSLLPWYFFPMIEPTSKHPIVNNLNAVKFEFVNSIDTIAAHDVEKTILLASSQYSKAIGSPAVVNIDILRKEPDTKQYNHPFRPVAVLLEGKFLSNYANRIPKEIANDTAIAFKDTSAFTKQIVISDGDVIRNDYRKSAGMPLPLGFDRHTGQFYGNKNFILNCIDYLCDNSGLMTLRSKEIKLRLLDSRRVEANLANLKIMNVAGPVLLLLIFAAYKTVSRKRKFVNAETRVGDK
jgi:ABC-2 type transport system permease protein